ncbi:MATE efflux family 5-like isoform X1 [Olea europaea subsp. europaea]|uniref:MATE efflux family 5-like isoform X1 n=1 Tax=Olea europaea subsp. europaea TaxID=158383 RepID=A0A8S0R3Z4_OLEEU|nr:MATE efflux family 5-like isoform X1 [Olea europaea subsp. europaea]
MEEVLLLKEDREEKRERVRWGLLIGEEMKRLGYLAGPMIAVTLSQYLLQVISVMMVGHLGELSLSSTSIAISLCGVTGFSFLVSYTMFCFALLMVNSVISCLYLSVLNTYQYWIG